MDCKGQIIVLPVAAAAPRIFYSVIKPIRAQQCRILIFAVFGALFFLPTASSAGTYIISYSGGTWTSSNNGSGSFGPIGNVGAAVPPQMVLLDRLQLRGQITATCTWDPGFVGDPVPASVIVTESCTAGVSGYAYGAAPSESASDGLGNGMQITGGGGNENTISSGMINTVQLVASFTITCNPTVSISAGAPCNLSAQITFQVTCTVPVVQLAGATMVNGAPSILIGQGLNPSLGGPLPVTVKSWQWNFSGDPFLGFPVVNQNTGFTGPAEMTAQTYQMPSPTYYYRSIGGPGSAPPATQTSNPQTATCVALCMDPWIGNLLTVTATATVQVYQPANAFKVYSTGVVSNHTDDDGNYVFGPWNAMPLPDGIGGTIGILFDGNVTTPAGFGGTPAGSIEFCQMETPFVDWTAPLFDFRFNNMYGLDQFPYEPVLNDPFLANGTDQYVGDAPGAYGFTQSVEINDSFSMYMLYLPPNNGNGAMPVALSVINWATSGTAALVGNVWTYPALPYPCSITNQATVQTSTLPKWNIEIKFP